MIFDVPLEKYKESNKFRKRDCYRQLIEYIKGNSTKVCAIYGLRRTGKSTMMFQAMKDVGLENSGYILCEEGDTYAQMCQKIDEYVAAGKKAVFIDEITKLSNFITTSAGLADYYSGTGTKIVITGTDSLKLNLVSHGELYDRTENIHTTYISYGEFMRLIEKTDMDDFIHYAGVLSHEEDVKDRDFFDRKTASHYIDSAISNNITNTFFSKRLPAAFIHRYEKLIGLHNRNVLVPAITAIVEMYSGVITKDILEEYFSQDPYVNADFSSAVDLLEKHNIFLDKQGFDDNFEARVAFALNSRRGISEQIDEDTVTQIKEYLTELDLLVRVPLVRHNDNNPKKEYSYTTEEYIYQAGMKYCQVKELVEIIKGSNEINLSPNQKEELCAKIERDVKGRILEITVFNDMQKLLDGDRYEIFKAQFVGTKTGEIDMVVHDKKENSYFCFEIKHSTQADDQQLGHLTYKPYHEILSKNYGTHKGSFVLYRGDTDRTTKNDAKYINVSSFLSELYTANDRTVENVIKACFNRDIRIQRNDIGQDPPADSHEVSSAIENIVKSLSDKAKRTLDSVSEIVAGREDRVRYSIDHIVEHVRHHFGMGR